MNPTSLETVLAVAGSSAGVFSAFTLYQAFRLVKQLVAKAGETPSAVVGVVRLYLGVSAALAFLLVGVSGFLGYNNRHFAETARTEAKAARSENTQLREAATVAAEKVDALLRQARTGRPDTPASPTPELEQLELSARRLRAATDVRIAPER